MIEVTVVGNLTSDPMAHATPNGTQVVSAGIAASNGFGDRKKTDYFRLSFFGARSDAITRYCHKGDKIMAIGEMNTSEWTDRDGNVRKSLDITVREYELCGGRSSEQQGNVQPEPRKAGKPAARQEAPVNLDEDNLPF